MITSTPEVRARLEGLKHDVRREELCARVMELLRLLRDSPGDQRVRRRRYHRHDAWGIPVRGSGEDWLILWRADTDRIEVIYLGPDHLR